MVARNHRADHRRRRVGLRPLRSAIRALGYAGALTASALIGLTAYGYAEARRDPVVVRYDVTVAGLAPDAPPLRIVQLTDIHYHWIDMDGARLTRIVGQVNALDPDVIVLTGDYSGGKTWGAYDGALSKALPALQGLHARLGVVAVRGNHDGPRRTPRAFRAARMLLLVNRWVDLGPVVIAGVDDETGTPSPWGAAFGAPPGKPLIMAAHEPDLALWAPPRVDLFLAGHTHGGQIVLPLIGTRSTGSRFLDTHLRGLFRIGGIPLIVSSGVGTSIVPIRIGVPPEIVVVTLRPRAYSVGRKSGTDR